MNCNTQFSLVQGYQPSQKQLTAVSKIPTNQETHKPSNPKISKTTKQQAYKPTNQQAHKLNDQQTHWNLNTQWDTYVCILHIFGTILVHCLI